jgi:DNA-binding PadR family transcriptional regulator
MSITEKRFGETIGAPLARLFAAHPDRSFAMIDLIRELGHTDGGIAPWLRRLEKARLIKHKGRGRGRTWKAVSK